ncbi:MAG: hypothetical protein AB7L09_00605 [Nitrospira sp.]
MSNELDNLLSKGFEDILRSLGGSSKSRSTTADRLRPNVVSWLLHGGTHEPSCGYAEKGDLLRWKDVAVSGTVYKLPTVRVDYLQLIVAGKIEIQGTELCKWILNRVDSDVRAVLAALSMTHRK